MGTKWQQEKLQARTVPCEEDIRGAYFRDQTKIIYSLAFRRLKDKTQVISDPDNDHVCTRIEHVMQVASVAKCICRGLNKKYPEWNLDEDLAFAIGLGHDLGHAPFGHAGEKAICNVLGNPKAFMHELHSYRVVEKIEKLNLTYAVKDGIICHNGEKFEKSIKPREENNKDNNANLILTNLDSFNDRNHYPATFEGCIARFADKIAYLGRDIEDALIMNIVSDDQVEKNIDYPIEDIKKNRFVNFFIQDLISFSSIERGIGFNKSAFDLMNSIIAFNRDFIYPNEEVKRYTRYSENIIKTLYDYLFNHQREYDLSYEKYKQNNNLEIDKAFAFFIEKYCELYASEDKSQNLSEEKRTSNMVVDFIAGMTDRFAITCFKEIMIPKPIKIIKTENYERK